MSRKLLMNNYSENGLMPVTDGLICWLDGRDYRNGETIWRDRSGNDNNADVTNCQGTGFSLRTTDNTSEFLVSRTLINNTNKPYTLEVYFKVNDRPLGSNENIILANSTKVWSLSTSLYLNISKRLFYDNGNNTILTADNFEINNPYFISITKKSLQSRECFLNGISVDINDTFITNGINFLGNCDDLKIKGDYYSIKLYNHVLSEEEIMQNYQYEQSIQRGE